MRDSTKAFFAEWMKQVDLKSLLADYYRAQLGVEDLSTIPMVTIEELMANQSGGPMCAIDKRGNLVYEASQEQRI